MKRKSEWYQRRMNQKEETRKNWRSIIVQKKTECSPKREKSKTSLFQSSLRKYHFFGTLATLQPWKDLSDLVFAYQHVLLRWIHELIKMLAKFVIREIKISHNFYLFKKCVGDSWLSMFISLDCLIWILCRRILS